MGESALRAVHDCDFGGGRLSAALERSRRHDPVTGIPIHPVFAEPKDRAGCLQRQSLVGDRPILLQLAGGFGVGPIARLYQGVLAVESPLEIVVVAGKNQEAKSEIEQIKVPSRHRVTVLGFTDQIDELMAVADVVLSKPGGLTTSEVLARGVGNGHRQSDPRPGESKQRLSAGKRCRDQDQQRGNITNEADGIARGLQNDWNR